MSLGSNNFDFVYSNFPLSRGVLESYVRCAIDYKKTVKDHKNSYNHASGLVDTIISCIASKAFSFNKDDRRTFKVLYSMLRDYACDNGVYTDEARTAMRVLCEYCGFAPDAIVLTDRKPLSRMERLKNRFSKWFGVYDEHDEQEDKIDQMFAEIERQKSRAKHDALVAEAERRRAELQREREAREQARLARAIHIQEEKQEETKPHVESHGESEEKEQESSAGAQHVQEEISQQTEKKQIKNLAQLHRERKKKKQKRSAKVIRIQKQQQQKETKNHKKTKTVRVIEIEHKTPEKRKFGRFAAISATITGFVALGAAILFGSHNSTDAVASIVDNNTEPTFKNIYVEQSSHYDNVSTYNMIDSLKKQKSNLDSFMQYRAPLVVKSEHITEEKQIVQNSADEDEAIAVTNASRSALNILIGAERAQKLYDNIEVKVKAGIFKLPDGMSVERVAHAMEMSRIYEGNSVILDALKSNVKLTAEQQQAFNDHIASIGDLGVKLQERMAKQHKLNNHSRYDKATKDLQMAHAKNLKQLRQLKHRTR